MAGKTFQGVVTSTKMQKTVVASISRQLRDPRTGKIVRTKKKYKIHCEDDTIIEGDKISFVESRPISKDKKFRFVKLLQKALEVSKSATDEETV